MSTIQLSILTHKPSRSIGLVFMSLSFIFGSWVVRLPELQTGLALTEGKLGLALLGMAIGSLIATPISGWLLNNMAIGKATLLSTSLACSSFLLVPFVSNVWMLFSALILIGMLDGFMNVSMNTAAAAIEKQTGVPILSSCHGMFSLGGMLGAISSGITAKMGIPLGIHLASVVLILLALMVYLRPTLLRFPSIDQTDGPSFAWPKRNLMGLVLIGFCIMLGEGAIADWSAIYIGKYLLADPLTASLGFASFSLAMAAGRFFGDAAHLHFGPKRMVTFGALFGATGIAVVILGQHPMVAVGGFLLVGAGFSFIVPILFSVAARSESTTPSLAIASIATGGVVGFLAGPPLIGLISEFTSLTFGLGILGGLAIIAAIVSFINPWSG